ncbi:hypothetical protein [Thiocapsa bogorovii]|uniref:hypothetical protein n=1 Tax=Thiocapsa bogorovii TaxID=521689 RepID=UPI001E2D0855|nr:hypothetical protein [Thiocapsa bogorovii]UHD15511.1 hypothetical protein LT988_19945 [Thiocapsa bogorovii]
MPREVVARNLPVEGIDYYARLDDGAILTLSHQTRYSGFKVEPPGAISAILGLTRAQWLARHRDDPAMAHDDRSYGQCLGRRMGE